MDALEIKPSVCAMVRTSSSWRFQGAWYQAVSARRTSEIMTWPALLWPDGLNAPHTCWTMDASTSQSRPIFASTVRGFRLCGGPWDMFNVSVLFLR